MGDESLHDIIKGDSDKVIDIINKGGKIVEYLTRENSVCRFMGNKIQFVSELGKGSQGTVYEIKFENDETKRYAVKMDKNVVKENIKDCSLTTDKTIKNLDNSGTIRVSKNEYICQKESFSEYIISILLAELYNKEISINFLDIFYFAKCTEDDVANYTFMEKIDNTVFGISKCINSVDMAENILIQILHGILCYQKKYKMVHGDLHMRNAFLQYIDDKTSWRGERLLDADYFEYKIGDISLYLKCDENFPAIVKIGDFGLGCKYSTPKVLNQYIMDTGYDQYIDNVLTPIIPNFYNEVYDTVLALCSFKDCLKYDIQSQLINSIFGSLISKYKQHEIMIKYWSGRINLNMIRKVEYFTPFNILTDKNFMSKYMQKPPKGSKIITLGEI